MTDNVLRVGALTVPCLLGLWTAAACRRAYYHGLPSYDAPIWAGLSGVFFLLSLMKTARGLGLLRGFGDFLRGRARGLGDLGPAVGLASHQALSPRRRLCGPNCGLRNHSLHFSSRDRCMERERDLGKHGNRPHRRRWGIGGGRRSALPAAGFSGLTTSGRLKAAVLIVRSGLPNQI
jgi:hypothetical protein